MRIPLSVIPAPVFTRVNSGGNLLTLLQPYYKMPVFTGMTAGMAGFKILRVCTLAPSPLRLPMRVDFLRKQESRNTPKLDSCFRRRTRRAKGSESKGVIEN